MAKSTHTPEYRHLCAALQKMRDASGLTQRALARKLKVVPSWVAHVERGERRIDLIEFAWWCLACGENPATAAPPLLALGSV